MLHSHISLHSCSCLLFGLLLCYTKIPITIVFGFLVRFFSYFVSQRFLNVYVMLTEMSTKLDKWHSFVKNPKSRKIKEVYNKWNVLLISGCNRVKWRLLKLMFLHYICLPLDVIYMRHKTVNRYSLLDLCLSLLSTPLNSKSSFLESLFHAIGLYDVYFR